jgi:hypothetical protein
MRSLRRPWGLHLLVVITTDESVRGDYLLKKGVFGHGIFKAFLFLYGYTRS